MRTYVIVVLASSVHCWCPIPQLDGFFIYYVVSTADQVGLCLCQLWADSVGGEDDGLSRIHYCTVMLPKAYVSHRCAHFCSIPRTLTPPPPAPAPPHHHTLSSGCINSVVINPVASTDQPTSICPALRYRAFISSALLQLMFYSFFCCGQSSKDS